MYADEPSAFPVAEGGRRRKAGMSLERCWRGFRSSELCPKVAGCVSWWQPSGELAVALCLLLVYLFRVQDVCVQPSRPLHQLYRCTFFIFNAPQALVKLLRSGMKMTFWTVSVFFAISCDRKIFSPLSTFSVGQVSVAAWSFFFFLKHVVPLIASENISNKTKWPSMTAALALCARSAALLWVTLSTASSDLFPGSHFQSPNVGPDIFVWALPVHMLFC